MAKREWQSLAILAAAVVVSGVLALACDGDSGGEPDAGGVDAGGPTCEEIPWSPETHYLVNGGTVARWQQTAFVDADGDGEIGDEEWIDVDVDFLELCESGKQSLVLIIATPNCPPCVEHFAAVREVIPEIQGAEGLIFAVYLGVDENYNITDVSNEEAAAVLMDENHLDGRMGDIWSGTHPAFNTNHGAPFTAVIDLENGEVLATDPIPELLTVDEILAAVHEANQS